MRKVKGLESRGIKTVVIFLTGRLLGIDRLIDTASAFVVAWLPGSEGQGVADVLIAGANGKAVHDFKGVLSFNWPYDLATLRTGKVTRYGMGYGLTYQAD